MLIGPFVALALGIAGAVRYGIGPSVLDLTLLVVLYAISGHGVTVGFHRYFTHGSFTAPRWLRATRPCDS
jgi:stearoyl-CoA desaturase (delta-9 desaturase)